MASAPPSGHQHPSLTLPGSGQIRGDPGPESPSERILRRVLKPLKTALEITSIGSGLDRGKAAFLSACFSLFLGVHTPCTAKRNRARRGPVFVQWRRGWDCARQACIPRKARDRRRNRRRPARPQHGRLSNPVSASTHPAPLNETGPAGARFSFSGGEGGIVHAKRASLARLGTGVATDAVLRGHSMAACRTR